MCRILTRLHQIMCQSAPFFVGASSVYSVYCSVAIRDIETQDATGLGGAGHQLVRMVNGISVFVHLIGGFILQLFDSLFTWNYL